MTDLGQIECKVLKEPTKELLDELYSIEVSAHKSPWTFDGIAASFDGNIVIVCFLDKKLVGFAVMQTVFDESELLTIGIMPEFQGRGLGKSLLSASLSEVKKRGAKKCFLEVRVSNLPALGFKKTGIRKNYYAKTAVLPAEDAYTMVSEL
ncbi:ribosomal protein S18-alanine N-acetyltransferase [Succinatimonas hippei]|uniref:ribosomal protein S18-alanine N-acetyltransferase n=1 Tax=Succinatimonas hippei TaxID=626938 RepID=UPI0026F257A5|nr:ribosomal protein S18-alanine N-acetyltransferase [Succinatimonas hippei]